MSATEKVQFQVELVWNREFHFVPYGNPHETLEQAIYSARDIENSGDGARVKKSRVLDSNGEVVWAYGKLVMRGGVFC